jgi:multicomponent Na+:H+ antiporter subunit B
MEHHVVLRVVAKLLMPLVLLFALYVQFHGDFGPGGGFQAGVIFASGFILYGLVFGRESLRQIAPPNVVQAMAAAGVLLYLAVGLASLMFGGSFLDYEVLSKDPVQGNIWGFS